LEKKDEFDKIKLPKKNYILVDTQKDDIYGEVNQVLKKILCQK